MSISTDNRKREEQYIGGDNSNESSRSDSSQENLGNGDTEILSTLIPLMEDLNVLKSYPLLCKSWNEFVCRASRKLPWVYCQIDESNPGNNDFCLELLVKNKTLGLPSPFGNIRICARTFRDQSFLTFLKYVRENPNSFSVELHVDPHRADVDPIELQTVLTTNQHNFKITQLFLSGEIRIGDIFQAETIRLPHLKLLSMRYASYISPGIVDLCENLVQFSPLKSLRIDGPTLAENLRKLIPPGGLKSVENLSLTYVRINSEDCKYLCERIMEIPCIKKLELNLHQHHSDNYYSGCKAIVDHFANTLEALTGDCLPIFENRSFPKLRVINYIRFSNFNNEFSLPAERFPLLKRVTFVVNKGQSLEYPCAEAENLGIEELSVQFREFNDYSDEILKFISAAGMVFPNVSSFSIVQTGDLSFSTSVLTAICKCFPKLTSLELCFENVEPITLMGYPMSVKKWLRKGWPLEIIPREASLLDFPGLEKLSFGPDVFLSEELFMHCLSKMPKLQYLTFHVHNDIVSAEKIRDSVGHLKRITIVVSLESFDDLEDLLAEEIERLRIMLPSVVEIRKIDSEYQNLP